jgi:endoglucanase
VAAPWPGNLVGGPWPTGADWRDLEDDYRTNEVAINWNGALIYALAAFVEPDTFDASVEAMTGATSLEPEAGRSEADD